MTQSTASTRPRKKATSKKKESFMAGLFSLMVKQCIFSAMIFGAIYYIKNSALPFSEPVCNFIKGAVGYEMTIEAALELAMGIIK